MALQTGAVKGHVQICGLIGNKMNEIMLTIIQTYSIIEATKCTVN
jgi:hypothetical protein